MDGAHFARVAQPRMVAPIEDERRDFFNRRLELISVGLQLPWPESMDGFLIPHTFHPPLCGRSMPTYPADETVRPVRSADPLALYCTVADVFEYHCGSMQRMGLRQCLYRVPANDQCDRATHPVGRKRHGAQTGEPSTRDLSLQGQSAIVLCTHHLALGNDHPIVRTVHHYEHLTMDERQVQG